METWLVVVMMKAINLDVAVFECANQYQQQWWLYHEIMKVRGVGVGGVGDGR